jgi:hypothetical protein
MHVHQFKLTVGFLILSVWLSACSPQQGTAIPTLGATPTPPFAPSETLLPTLLPTGTVAAPDPNLRSFEGIWIVDFHQVTHTGAQTSDIHGSQVSFYLQRQGDHVTGALVGREPFGVIRGSVDAAGVFRGTLTWSDDVEWESLTMRFSTAGTSLVGTAVREVSPGEWEFFILYLQPSQYQ